MLDIKTIRSQQNEILNNLKNRGIDLDLQAVIAADDERKNVLRDLEEVRNQRKQIGRQNAQIEVTTESSALPEKARDLRVLENQLQLQLQQAEQESLLLLQRVPNLTHPDSPTGLDEASNVVLREVGEKPQFTFAPRDHLDLMEAHDLVDFEGAAKVTGQKFYYLKNQAVLLEAALVRFTLDFLQAQGITLFSTPDLARKSILEGIGFNPKGNSTQVYTVENTDLALIATAEITLGGLLANTVVEESALPILWAGLSHCFRTEAGSAGRESRGLYRVHQFTKVELFAFTHPDQSEAMHLRLLEIEEAIYQKLGIPYRVLDICSGDLGAPAYRKYDLEAWIPSQQKWGEITSTSNCTDYQARRLNIRFKQKGKKGTQHLHMLNGTAIAVPRVIIALIENGQQADGSIQLPPCLNLADINPT